MRSFIQKAFQANWPVEKLINNYEPNFIFLLTPPNSGSTAISQIFVNSPNISQLHESGEGQWLIKGLCSNDRWNPKKYINEQSIRSVWINACHKKYIAEGALHFIEKSPPNMMRIQTLQSIFPKHIILANNRDPYASISSIFYRYTKHINKLTSKKREMVLKNIANKWLNRSINLKKIIDEQNIPYLSYENICQKPNILQEAINNSDFGGAIKLDFSANLNVKAYQPQPLLNFNSKQIARLNSADIKLITGCLQHNEKLLSYFGYSLRDKCAVK